MTTLAINKPRAFEGGIFNELPVVAADIIYEGAAVGILAGNARPLVAADNFQGFAVKKADNSAGAAGAITVKIQDEGDIELDVVGVTGITNQGATVYASDDDTFTLSSTGNSSIGKIKRWISGTKCIVAFQSVAKRSL